MDESRSLVGEIKALRLCPPQNTDSLSDASGASPFSSSPTSVSSLVTSTTPGSYTSTGLDSSSRSLANDSERRTLDLSKFDTNGLEYEITVPDPPVEPWCEVRETPEKGKGLYATRSIKPGTLILSELPLINLSRKQEKSAEAIGSAYEALTKKQKKAYKSLFSAEKSGMDMISSIYYSNCYNTDSFTDPESSSPLAQGGSCIGLLASRVNHSCVPNVSFHYVAPADVNGVGVMQFYAFRPIAKGKELLSNYNKHMFESSKKRQQMYLHDYGFRCSCEACLPPSDFWSKSDTRRAEMRRLIGELKRLENEWKKEGKNPAAVQDITRQATVALLELEPLLVKEKMINKPLANVYQSLAKWTTRAGKDPRKWLAREYEIAVTISGKDSRWSLALGRQL